MIIDAFINMCVQILYMGVAIYAPSAALESGQYIGPCNLKMAAVRIKIKYVADLHIQNIDLMFKCVQNLEQPLSMAC